MFFRIFRVFSIALTTLYLFVILKQNNCADLEYGECKSLIGISESDFMIISSIGLILVNLSNRKMFIFVGHTIFFGIIVALSLS